VPELWRGVLDLGSIFEKLLHQKTFNFYCQKLIFEREVIPDFLLKAVISPVADQIHLNPNFRIQVNLNRDSKGRICHLAGVKGTPSP
jgi:hypothetical protein